MPRELPELPLELYDKILDCLWNDKQALLACSVASRILTVSSQKRLFSRITLPRPSKITQKERPSELGISYSILNRFLDQSPHIAGYVECLQILAPPEFFSVEGENGSHVLWNWLSAANSAPPKFFNLKAVIVGPVDNWYQLCPRARSIIFSLLRLPSVVYVELGTFPIPIFTQAVGNNIKHLCVHTCRKGKPFRDFPNPGPAALVPINLDSMSITDSAETFLSFLFTDPDCRIKTNQLRKLVVNLGGDRLIAHAMTWTLLQSCADTLEELAIRPSPSVCLLDDCYQEEIDISKLTSLKKFEVWIDYDRDSNGEIFHGFRWLGQFLTACSSSNERLGEMTIVTKLESACWEIIDRWLWRDIFDALLIPCFSKLKMLNIIFAHECCLHILNRNVQLLTMSKQTARLRQFRQGLDVNIIYRIGQDQPLPFSPDTRWSMYT